MVEIIDLHTLVYRSLNWASCKSAHLQLNIIIVQASEHLPNFSLLLGRENFRIIFLIPPFPAVSHGPEVIDATRYTCDDAEVLISTGC